MMGPLLLVFNLVHMNLTQTINLIKKYLLGLQLKICDILEQEDGRASFLSDPWEHLEGGGGITKTIANGQVIEKAGINFSYVLGPALPAAATLKRPELTACPFHALGTSVVVHPYNPYAPTAHMNVRFVAVERPHHPPLWWFGGGFDLTPYYGFIEDCIHWHKTAKAACLPFGEGVYRQFKQWCDEYFYLPHRKEPRGIGGLFFDDLNAWGFDGSFAFMQSIGDHFMQAYQPILAKRKALPFGEKERQFQCYRRGRYVEFNLLYDRGTLFGVQSKGRTESILMSLPPKVAWEYNWRPVEGSKEEQLYKVFLIKKDWLLENVH